MEAKLNKAAEDNNLSEVKQLLEDTDDLSKYSTAISECFVLASSKGNLEIMRCLLYTNVVNPLYKSYGKDTIREKDALQVATSEHFAEVLAMILNYPNMEKNIDNMSYLLMTASEKGKTDAVELLLSTEKSSININWSDREDGVCILSKAAQNGHATVVELLLRQPDINVNAVDKERSTVLMFAAIASLKVLSLVLERIIQNENADETKILLHTNLNRTDGNGYSALHWTFYGNNKQVEENLEQIKLLHRAGVDVNIQDNKGRTVLMHASIKGYAPIVKYLLDLENVKYNVTDINGQTAVTHAATDEIEELLLAMPYLDLEEFNRMKLINAATRGNLEKVKIILAADEGVNVNATDPFGNTALLNATKLQRTAVVKELIECSETDVNHGNHKHESALIWAVQVGNFETVKLLLARSDLNVNQKDDKGNTALMRAVALGQTQMVEILLNCPLHKVDANAKNNAGNSALELAHAFGNPSIVDILMLQESVYDNLDLVGESSEFSRKIINEAGKRNNTIWSNLFSRSPERVFQILILMSTKITSDRVEDQNKLWKYTFEQSMVRKHLKGDVTDTKGNTLFHYIAQAENQTDANNLLELIPIKYYPDLSNKLNENGDTMLHVSLKNGKLDVFHAMLNRFQPYSEYVCPWVNDLLTAKNNARNTVLSIALKSNSVTDESIQGIMERLKPNQLRLLCKAIDRDHNTLLHLATVHNRTKLTDYLATQPVDVQLQNKSGFTALHLAVTENHVELTKRLYHCLKHRGVGINDKTAEGETAMHIAFKSGNREMIKQLVEFGGDLDSQDADGNTPLHDLVQLLHLDTIDSNAADLKTFCKVWKFVSFVCTPWWYRKHKKSVPDTDAELYINMKQEAMYHLRSEIPNKKGLSVLEYAAAYGLHDIVHIMLTEQDTFVVRSPSIKANSSKPNFEIEVSNLMPEYYFRAASSENKKASRTKASRETKAKMAAPDIFSDSGEYQNIESESDRLLYENKSSPTPSVASNHDRISSSFLETLAKVKPPVKVSAALESFPMELLARHQWYVYQVLFIILLALHTSLMIWYTYKSQSSVVRLRGKDSTGNRVDTLSEDLVIMIYILTLMTLLFASYLYYKILKRNQGGNCRIEDDRGFPDYIEAKGALLNFLTYVVAMVAEHFTKILFLVFGLGSMLLVIFSRHLDNYTIEHYSWIKGMTLFSGWLLVLTFLKAYSPIYNFIIILKYIFVKNMVPFLLLYVVMTVAFACTIQLQFQLLSEENVSEQGSDWLATFTTQTPNVIWELFIMTAGMDADMQGIQSVGQMFTDSKYNSSYVEFLLLMYGIASIVILLNMIIAAMNETYSSVLQRQGKGWRQFQVKAAIQVRRLTFGVFDRLVRWIAGARQDPISRRWYLPISDTNLKQIRVKYWKVAQDISEDDKGILDRIKSLMETLSKEDDMQKKQLDNIITLVKTLSDNQ